MLTNTALCLCYSTSVTSPIMGCHNILQLPLVNINRLRMLDRATAPLMHLTTLCVVLRCTSKLQRNISHEPKCFHVYTSEAELHQLHSLFASKQEPALLGTIMTQFLWEKGCEPKTKRLSTLIRRQYNHTIYESKICFISLQLMVQKDLNEKSHI